MINCTKICNTCLFIKDYSHFSRDSAAKDGRKNKCAVCQKDYEKTYKHRRSIKGREWYAANKKRKAETAKLWYLNNKQHIDEKNNKWRNENKERVAERRKWRRSKDLASVRATEAQQSAKRRLRKRNNTPEITELEASMIKGLYLISQILSNSCKEQYHVDHILPIAKKGPHTYENLRVIPASENLSKGAK